MAPINGISLERYAELSAHVSDTNDPEQQAQIAERQGVSRTDWQAAKDGWTARMMDMSLMGRVATAYMPLYQAALARKGGSVSASFEDFVAISGAAKAMTIEGALAHYGISMGDWTQIAGQWTNQIAQNPMQYGGYGMLVEQEGERIRAGGPPRPVSSISRAAPVAGAPQTGAPGAQPGGVGPGTHVLVQWSDGNRYPGAVVQSAQGQHLVAFPDGRQLWVPAEYVAPR